MKVEIKSIKGRFHKYKPRGNPVRPEKARRLKPSLQPFIWGGIMGKAAAQRKAKRMKALSELAKNNPDIFKREWEKRINSWMILIGQKAGEFRDAEGENVAPVFGIVAEAIETLRFCGEKTFKEYAPQTYELLNNECTRQLAAKIDSRLCLTNNFHRLEEMAIYHVR